MPTHCRGAGVGETAANVAAALVNTRFIGAVGASRRVRCSLGIMRKHAAGHPGAASRSNGRRKNKSKGIAMLSDGLDDIAPWATTIMAAGYPYFAQPNRTPWEDHQILSDLRDVEVYLA